MTEVQRRVEKLRASLAEAARDNFAALGEVALGKSLHRAPAGVAKALPDDDSAPLKAWLGSLLHFDSMERDLQMIEVARGMRMCRALAGRAPAPPRARSSEHPLSAPTDSLPGVGPAIAARLAERGLCTIEDLIWLVPRRYDDVRSVTPLAELARTRPIGERVVVSGRAESVRFVRRGRRGWIDLRMGDGQELIVRWFNAHPGQSKRYQSGCELVLSGRLTERGGALEMANPDVLRLLSPDGAELASVDGIVPRYSDVPGVGARLLRKAIAAAVERGMPHVAEVIPAEVRERRGLPGLAEALRSLHAPADSLSAADVEALSRGESEWHRRLAFEELFVLGLVVARRRIEQRAHVARPCPEDASDAVRAALPFSLTGAQERAADEIAADLAREAPMNRLLQGDVGSGKTAVALFAVARAARSGAQSAIMAPTEILAEQHHATLAPWCEELGVRLRLLTASTPKAVRSSTLALLAAGEIDAVVGTHALLADGVTFARLALVIVDEQHRFGVAQRVRLREKGDGLTPHLLVMTATPIPRTLALTAYGDLDVSVLDELPPGRTPTRTHMLTGRKGRDSTYRALRRRLERGERAFVVCPLVAPPEDDTGRDWADAETVFSELCRELAPHPVALCHGRLGADERAQAMEAMRSGRAAVLVATTVIEVGVDIPEATVMVIEDADHFGLAQLHQLRGRVGRGGGPSECVLLSRGRASDDGARRMEVIAETTDGFRIAEEDLQLRGPGEVLGARQAGLPRLRFGDLRAHAELLAQAREDADRLASGDPELAAPELADLRAILVRREQEIVAYGAESG